MPKFHVLRLESSQVVLADEAGQAAILPLSVFSSPVSVGATVFLEAALTDTALSSSLAHDVLTELLNPPTP
jgi:hypothetical protein